MNLFVILETEELIFYHFFLTFEIQTKGSELIMLDLFLYVISKLYVVDYPIYYYIILGVVLFGGEDF